MFTIISPKLLELFHTQTISQLLDLSSKVALFNVNYWRPYLVVTLAEASLFLCSAARVLNHLTHDGSLQSQVCVCST